MLNNVLKRKELEDTNPVSTRRRFDVFATLLFDVNNVGSTFKLRVLTEKNKLYIPLLTLTERLKLKEITNCRLTH